MSHKEKPNLIANVFDDWAESGRADRMAEGHQFAATHAFDYLDVQADMSVLDIGCGLGYAVRWAASVDPTVSALGIDLAPNMIKKASALSTELPGATFRSGQFPEVVHGIEFDRIFSVEALYYMPNLDIALEAVVASLKPGGKFVTVIDHYFENDACHDWHEMVGVPLVLWSIEEWTAGLSRAGLEAIGAQQLRHPSTEQADDWQQSCGSLILWGMRPV